MTNGPEKYLSPADTMHLYRSAPKYLIQPPPSPTTPATVTPIEFTGEQEALSRERAGEGSQFSRAASYGRSSFENPVGPHPSAHFAPRSAIHIGSPSIPGIFTTQLEPRSPE